MTEQIDQFKSDLATAVNCCSRENASNTPDFILAEFMERCLQAFEAASKRREDWYGHHLSIGGDGQMPHPVTGYRRSVAMDGSGVFTWRAKTMSRLKSGIGIACILFAGAFLLVFDLFFESTAYLWFLKGYIAFVNLQLLAFFLFQFFVQPCTEHICWNAKHKSRDGNPVEIARKIAV